jgi:hypothetical protein
MFDPHHRMSTCRVVRRRSAGTSRRSSQVVGVRLPPSTRLPASILPPLCIPRPPSREVPDPVDALYDSRYALFDTPCYGICYLRSPLGLGAEGQQVLARSRRDHPRTHGWKSRASSAPQQLVSWIIAACGVAARPHLWRGDGWLADLFATEELTRPAQPRSRAPPHGAKELAPTS